MKRTEVYDVINGERDYQEKCKSDNGSHVVEDFPLAAGMESIRYNLDEANYEWYNGKTPHPNAMVYLRKIAAICVQMGEKYDMPKR